MRHVRSLLGWQPISTATGCLRQPPRLERDAACLVEELAGAKHLRLQRLRAARERILQLHMGGGVDRQLQEGREGEQECRGVQVSQAGWRDDAAVQGGLGGALVQR